MENSKFAIGNFAIEFSYHIKMKFIWRSQIVGNDKILFNSKRSSRLALSAAPDGARAALGYLLESRIATPHGLGYLAPVVTNRTEAGRQKNRRVELVER